MKEVWADIEELLVHKDRIITEVEGNDHGPALAFCAGIHGNEPSGVIALKNIFSYIHENNIPVTVSLLHL